MKKFITVFLTLLVATMVFAKEVKSVGVTDSDVKNYAKNFKSISKEIEKLGDSSKAMDKLDAILEKYGISGPNRFDKYQMITLCAQIVIYDYSMEKDPESAAIMKKMGMDPVADIRKMVNQKDYEVVYANAEQLSKVIK